MQRTTPGTAAQIRIEEQLDVSLQRVSKLDAPLLIIGLGGTGKDAVLTIKATFARRFELPTSADGNIIPVPRRTGYLVIDSDTNGRDGLDNGEFVNISDGINLAALLQDPNHNALSPQQKKWVHRNLHSVGPQGGTGMGTYRAAARLALDCRMDAVYNAIRNKLEQLVTINAGGDPLRGSAFIFVVTGLGGGTGSGTFLDVAQIIRHMMRTETTLQVNYSLNAYIVTPDLTLAHLHEQNAAGMMEGIVKFNSYAALKELDFWMDYGRHKTHYVMNFTNGKNVQWGKPFDHVTLMSGSNVAGSNFADGYKLVQRTIAENLLHYMADEKTEKDEKGNANYSFLSYESNLDAQSAQSVGRMPLPLCYGYRAVGAYSKRIPKKKLLYYEGSLLFKTFIPPRNEHRVIVPNDKLLTDGGWEQRFGRVALSTFEKLYDAFKQTGFPSYCGDFSAKNQATVTSLRNRDPAVHANFTSWEETTVAPAAAKFIDLYLAATWQRFVDLCKEIMSDPALGPFSLKAYLLDQSRSLRVHFENYAAIIRSKANNLYISIGDQQQVCQRLYQEFLRPPLITLKNPVQLYLDALKNLLDLVRQYELSLAHASALETMTARIRAYTDDALVPLCNLIEELEADFQAAPTSDSLSSDLIDPNKLHGDIDAQFASANAEDAVSRDFLGRLCDSTFETAPNVNTGGCGLTFLFRQNAKLKALSLMKDVMDVCCKGVNNQSLDSIVDLQAANPDPAVQAANVQNIIESTALSVVQSAQPLFSLSTDGIINQVRPNVTRLGYFSVPQDAASFLNYLKPGAGGAGTAVQAGGVSLTPKASALTDHIFCNVTWDALPLYSYMQLGDMKRAYDEIVGQDASASACALHLVCTQGDADYTRNWRLIPDPAPFYLFSKTGSPREEAAYADARSLVKRALASVMLTIDSTKEDPIPFPNYTFHFFLEGGNIQDAKLIIEQLEAVLAMRNPITSAPAAPEAKLTALDNLMAKTQEKRFPAAKSPTVMSVRLALDPAVVKINPFDSGIQQDIDSLREAKQNYAALTDEYAAHILLQTPELLRNVRYQISAFEAISKARNDITFQANRWEPRIGYAETFGALYAYGLIRFDLQRNPVYDDAVGEVAPLIQDALFSEDLKVCTPVVKAVGAAADLNAQHPIRADLEGKLKYLERNWNSGAQRGTLEVSEVRPQLKRMQDLAERSDEELRRHRNALQRDLKADHALLGKYIALIEKVKGYADRRADDLQYILDQLGGAPAPTPTPGPTPTPPTDSWVCPNCGKTGLTDMFCPSCGCKRPEPTPSKPAEVSWVCPNCGKTGLTGKFCSGCGANRP